jgi:hypothetical protein
VDVERRCIALSEAYFRDGPGLEVGAEMVRACAERPGTDAGCVTRALARAATREQEGGAFHERRLDPEERLATPEAGLHPINRVRRRYTE